ncbi:unnamed protein product, partial [Mesorhabditis belari]|uniref:Histone H2A/H2B/H3 domain-containing protein n=1 Tax=Mesorhabditis belari TaxID=2138241 RepID=A0AAF3F5H9_9BILA
MPPIDDRVRITREMNATGTGPNASLTIKMTEEYSRTSNLETIRQDQSNSALRDVSNFPSITTPLSHKFITTTPVRPTLHNYRALPGPAQSRQQAGAESEESDSNGESDESETSSDEDRSRQQLMTSIRVPTWRGSRKYMPQKRFPTGARALQEIRRLQTTTNLLIQKRPFQRLVREVAYKMAGSEKYWQSSALEALQEASEAFLLRFFEDGNLCMGHRKRKTLTPQDIQLVRRLQNF